MFGPFRITQALGFSASSPMSSGLLWKIPWKLSTPRKFRQRTRLRKVDRIVDVLENALRKKGQTTQSLERWKHEMPREEEMLARDKYTLFDRKVRGYRKGIHKLPKWTRISQRRNPPGY